MPNIETNRQPFAQTTLEVHLKFNQNPVYFFFIFSS